MPTDFECAALCYDVYRDLDRPPLPTGWTIFADYTTLATVNHEGYFGACYIKQSDSHYDIVFAHRGTVLLPIKDATHDIAADLTLGLGKIPAQFSVALEFVNVTTNTLIQKYGKENCLISQTGHSLGAVIAELFVVNFKDDLNGTSHRLVTFESPGSKPIFQAMMAGGKLPADALEIADKVCWIIHADINVINTCNQQVAAVKTIKRPYNYAVLEGPIKIIPKEYFLNFYYLIGYSVLDQHKISSIYNALLTDCNYIYNNSYPAGLAAGYQNYLYGNHALDYWGGYIQYLWDNHQDIQTIYKGVYQDYYTYFQKTYLQNNLTQESENATSGTITNSNTPN